MSWACLLRTYTSWHEKCEAYSDAVLDLLRPYLYDLLQNPLTVFKKPWAYTTCTFTKWYKIGPYRPQPQGLALAVVHVVSVLCIWLAGCIFTSGPVLETSAIQCIYITLYSYIYIYTYLQHPPVLKFGLLAKSIKIQPLKIKKIPWQFS